MTESLLNPVMQTVVPADTASVADIVREATKEGRAIYPRGGGTHWNYGGVCDRPGIELSLEKMNRLIDHAADDMTVTAEAGMTFAELSKILATKNQRLPIDVPQPEKATLGGLVAVNQAGPRQFGYGTVRDYLIGYTAVDGEGTIFHGGGRVVKNAAGYNMTRLMAGSLGTLSILTQLTFMVRPLPELSVIAGCELPDFDTAEKTLAELNTSQVRPVAVELLSESKQPLKLFAGFEGPAAEVRWMLETLPAGWKESDPIWQQLAEFAADARLVVLPSQTVELIAQLKSKYVDCRIQAHAGNGVVLVESGWGRAEGKSYYRQLRTIVETLGGNMTVLSHPEDIELSQEEIWGPSPSGLSVMRSLKERFDPRNILNPGRLIFE
jgi:glycolate oxidase FAD binding subunit